MATKKRKKQLQKNRRHPIHRTLTPSWISGSFALLCAIAFSALAVIIFMQTSGTLQHHLIDWQAKPVRPLTTPDEILPENDTPNLATSWPLIIFWGVIGLAVYGIASYFVHTATRTAHFKDTIRTIKSEPPHELELLVEHLLLRILAAIALVWLLVIFVRFVLPYALLACHAAASDITSFSGILYGVWSALVLVTSLHVLTVFLRLSTGKTRILT